MDRSVKENSLNRLLWHRAKMTAPGGVHSPVRSCMEIGGEPLFIKRAHSCYLVDCEDREYIDYMMSWGAILLGHAHPVAVQAVYDAVQCGTVFGASHSYEIELAELLCQNYPGCDLVRFVSSGTEAIMSAIRIARGYTKRDLIVKFSGCYHGHSDSLLVSAGSGLLTSGKASSEGVPAEIAKLTRVLEYNDLEQLESCFKHEGLKIATVVVEPIAGNMGLIFPNQEWIQRLRSLTEQYGVVLIFDEIMSGFRVSAESAQGHLGISPDMVTFGKVISGGLPLAAYGGRRDIMSCVAPLGGVYQAGTLSGNPVVVRVALMVMRTILSDPDFYDDLSRRSLKLTQQLQMVAYEEGYTNFCTQSIGGMIGAYFRSTPPKNQKEALHIDAKEFSKFFHLSLEEGLYWPPSAYEAFFLSHSHTDSVIDKTIIAVRKVFQRMVNSN